MNKMKKEYLKKHYCIICKKEICYQNWKTGSKMCGSCSCKGRLKDSKNNGNFVDGRSLIKPKCIDCSQELSDYRTTRCKKCNDKEHSKRMKGIVFTEEHKRRIGLKHRGKIVSQETCKKISLSKGGTGIPYKNKNDYFKDRRKTNINFKLSQYLRTRIWWALKGICKSAKTIKLLGCSIENLKQHLEMQFKPEMTWDNYGKWHIDHIKPCASFDLSKPNEQQKCFHYTNLQPLWALENLIKKDKIILSKKAQ